MVKVRYTTINLETAVYCCALRDVHFESHLLHFHLRIPPMNERYETLFNIISNENHQLEWFMSSAYLPLEQSILHGFKANLKVRRALSVYGIWIAMVFELLDANQSSHLYYQNVCQMRN